MKLPGPLHKLVNTARRHPRISLAIIFVAVWVAASYVFFRRFPDNATSPNFYAEDGLDFMTNILKQGPLRALFDPFNGYFIVGIYLLGDAAALINRVLFSGEFIQLPLALALSSYIFLGFCAALPIITLNKVLRPAYMALAVVAIAFVPMPQNDYVVIGTIGNLKFAFGFIAILLIAKRWSLSRTSKLLLFLDAGVLICAYTTPTVYLMLPFYLFCDGLRPKQLLAFRKTWKLRNVSLWSAVGLGAVLSLQVLYVATHGIPKLPGYLDTPFQFSEAIEIFLGRSLLFGFAPGFYRFLNDVLTVAGVVLLAFAAAWSARGERLRLIVLCAYSAVLASVLFLLNRPGLSSLFHSYSWSGPDQFFYAQTMMMAVAGVVLLQALSGRLERRWAKIGLFTIAAFGIAVFVPTDSSYGKAKLMEDTQGTIYATAKAACKQPGDSLKINIYPTPPWQVIASRAEVCTAALKRHRTFHIQDLGLTVHANNPVELTQHRFTQPFTTSVGSFAGIEVFFSTYQKKLSSDYLFTLYRADCKTPIETAEVEGSELSDNSMARITLATDQGQGDYCFSIAGQTSKAQPLAVQMSSVNPNGVPPVSIDGKAAGNPITFATLFEDQ